MEKYLKLYANLEKCYLKLSYTEYVMSPDEVKENTCKTERDALADYVNSDAMNHENILRERINQYKGIHYI
jgi:hypothetical protein